MPSNNFERFCEENLDALDILCAQFADYAPKQGFNVAHLRAWLHQFHAQHRPLAIKLAKAIEYYSTDQITGLMRPLKKLIDEHIVTEGATPKSVFYVPFGSADESGGDILRRYRNVNKLHGLKQQFVTLIELPEKLFHENKPVVFFFDDFIGTGKQVTDGWTATISQVIPDYIPIYLAVVAGLQDGIKRVENETKFHVLCVHTLGARNQLMESACRQFSNQEKNTLKRYCDDAGNHPLGFGDHGLLVSFAYGTPNNSISVIRGSKKQSPWRGLLPNWQDLQA